MLPLIKISCSLCTQPLRQTSPGVLHDTSLSVLVVCLVLHIKVVLLFSVFLVEAPIINYPKLEYPKLSFMVAGALLLAPFVSYKVKLPYTGQGIPRPPENQCGHHYYGSCALSSFTSVHSKAAGLAQVGPSDGHACLLG